MAFLPSGGIPYQQYILKDSFSLASRLKQIGYQTAAFHPGERTSWQRDQAYPRLGFDSFKSVDELNVPITTEHGYVSDETDFNQILWEYEHRDPDKPLFLFNVTIQNHGAYTVKDYPAEIYLTDQPGRYPMAEQYLTLVNKTEEQFMRLTDYFSRQDEPVLILMFGDHQPSVEQAFLDKAYGVDADAMTMEDYMNKYRVPFVIWANYPLPQLDPQETSLNFLSTLLLQYAGLEADRYGQYLQSRVNRRLSSPFPAISIRRERLTVIGKPPISPLRSGIIKRRSMNVCSAPDISRMSLTTIPRRSLSLRNKA